MALNWAMLDESKLPVPIGEEHTVMTVHTGVEVTLNIPEAGKDPKKFKESGGIWLTEQRVPVHFMLFVVSFDVVTAHFR